MQLHAEHIIGRLCVAGINHTNAGTVVRGSFSVDQHTHGLILEEGRQLGIQSVFVISTCNRTEIYGYAHHPCELAALLTKYTKGSMQELMQQGYHYQGKEALHHIFRVACGLDSQIIGDYEIQGQLKQAYTFSMAQNMVGPIMDRTINFVFQASKKIRSTTGLSTGTVSVSFAAIEWMQKNLDNTTKNVLLVGGGKFGRNVCKNIRHYLPQCNLTITNRTDAVGAKLAEETGASYLPFASMVASLDSYDVILVCTNAMEPIIKAAHFKEVKPRVVIDLSMPANVEPSVGSLAGTTLVNVDEISAIPQHTITRRQHEIPKALAIIEEYKSQFSQWVQTYQHAPAIRHIKENLRLLSSLHPNRCEMAGEMIPADLHMGMASGNWQDVTIAQTADQDEQIRKTVSNLMVNLKTKKEKGCQFITAYNHFLSQDDTALH
jgi:glutamyl-tRNA reductase